SIAVAVSVAGHTLAIDRADVGGIAAAADGGAARIDAANLRAAVGVGGALQRAADDGQTVRSVNAGDLATHEGELEIDGVPLDRVEQNAELNRDKVAAGTRARGGDWRDGDAAPPRLLCDDDGHMADLLDRVEVGGELDGDDLPR